MSSSLMVQIWSLRPAAIAGLCRFQRLHLFGIRYGLAHQPPIHLARCQVCALHIRGVSAQQFEHLVWIPIDHVDLHCRDATARPFFDDLHVLPRWLRLLLGGWPSPPVVGRHLAPGLHQRGAIVAFAIRRQCGRLLRMAALLELRHQLMRHRFLGLTNRSANAQPTIHIYGDAAPEGAALRAFGIPPFSPLLPT
jgi:hypothetical protein